MRTLLAKAASRSGNVVTARDLRDAGLDHNAIVRLRRDGLLIRLFHGTYAVPPVGGDEFTLACRGAVAYAGVGAVVVGESALALRSRYPAPAVPEVAVPRSRYVRATPGLAVRRVGDEWLRSAADVSGAAVQAAAPAVVWAWSRLDGTDDRRALACAAVGAGAASVTDVRAAASRLSRVRGRADLAATLSYVEEGCESPAEIDYLLDVERRFGLPRGERQVRIDVPGGRVRRVDVRYGRVVVEIDGAHHSGQRGEDAVRDVVLTALGLHVVRVPAVEVRRRPGLVAATVAAALRSQG
jgi:hypothetical protein